jgi:pimeloyl-ACP methyl ester carboxylesterase
MGIKFAAEVTPQDKFVQGNGLRLHYLDWGNSHLKPLLLLHGGGQNAHMWDFFALAMRDRHHILALDQRGHGDSDWHPDRDYSEEAYLRDLEEFTREVGLRRFILGGLSLGGRNSYTYTAHYPEQVEALIIVDVGPELNPTGTRHIGEFLSGTSEFDSLEELARHAHYYDPRRPVEQFLGSVRNSVKKLPNGKWTWKHDRGIGGRSSSGQTRAGLNDPETVARHWGYIEKIRCPTLIVRGGDSDVFMQEVAERMQKLIPGSRLATVPNAGHLTSGDNPVGFEKAVREFLATLGPHQ